MIIHSDILERLPVQGRSKLQLIADLAADALADADAAQSRLNDLARRSRPDGVGEDPSVVRLAAKVEVQTDRHQALFGLFNACQRWLRSLPPAVELEVVAAPGPPPDIVGKDEMVTAEEAAMRLRSRLAQLTIERMEVANAPEPKADIKRAIRAQMANLAADSGPTLRAERGKVEAVFLDHRADFGITPSWVAGVLCWLLPTEMAKALDAMVDAAIPDDGSSMTMDEQRAALEALDREIEVLERSEESLIETAFTRGVDVLRRQSASPAAVLGVRLPKLALSPRRERRRFAGPAHEARAAE
jgi:hypothetical protein